MELGPVGIWWSGSWPKDPGELSDTLGQLHLLGYETVWRSGGFDRGLNPDFARFLEANNRIKVASGIHSIWTTTAQETASAVARLEASHPGRFLLGLGVSHAPMVESTGIHYRQPLRHMVEYLDALDAARPTVEKSQRALAALGPRMLALAAERAGGAHPYFVPLEHTRQARGILGPEALLAPEVAVVLETDPQRAREIARSHMQLYLGLDNYTRNLRRLGYEDQDLDNGGSDRLVDDIVAWGDEEAIGARIKAQLHAGASHVCVQVLNGESQEFPLDEYRRLAPALFSL